MRNLASVFAVLALGASVIVVGCDSDEDDKSDSSAGSSGRGSSTGGRSGAGGASGGSTSVPGGAAGESDGTPDEGGASGASGAGGAPDEATGGSGDAGNAGESSGGGGGKAGGGSGGGSSGGASNGACNELVNLGTAVTPVGSSANRPNWAGGTIVDGTYVLTSSTEYNTSQTVFSESRKRTLKIAGNTVQIVNSDNGGPDVHATISIAPETNGPLLHAAFTCPTTTGTLADYFSATPTSLKLRKSGEELVYTYTLQL